MHTSSHTETSNQLSTSRPDKDIYISYSLKDRNTVKEIILPILDELYKEKGYTYWYDEHDLCQSDNFALTIKNAIKNGKVFLTLHSENTSINAPGETFFKQEWKEALERQHNNTLSGEDYYFILPVIKGTPEEVLYKPFQQISFLNIDTPDFSQKLKSTIEKIIRENTKENDGNQYIGLLSYEAKHAHLFWGRNNDIKRISNIILDNISTFLFGASGCGKTSLLRAGIAPKLNDYNFYTVYITPREAGTKGEEINIWEIISEEINNIIKQHELIPEPKYNNIQWNESTPLWDKLYLFNYRDNYYFNHYFLIIIDQFEEVFQSNLKLKNIQDLFIGYELLCGYYRNNSVIQRITNKKELIGEKFEEYRHIDIEIPHRFILSLRRDFMYEMESHADDFPIFSKNRVCLKPLNEEQAVEIITSSVKPNGEKCFTLGDAISIIRDLTGRSDFKIDGIPELEIDAMILSLYLKETCDSKLIQQNNTISKDYIDASSVIQSYYSRHMTHPGVENLESLLVTPDGLYRKPITNSEAENYITADILNKYIELGILKTYMHRDIKWVELSHDKLCSCVARRKSVALAKKSNRKIISPYLYLLPQGRLEFCNSFYDEVYRDPKVSRTFIKWLSFMMRRGIIDPNINMDLSGLYLNSDVADNCTISLKLNDSTERKCYTEDGIDEIIVKLAKDKLISVSYMRDNGAYSIYHGVHKIEFYYDKAGRLILLDFFDIDNERFLNAKGFTSIFYEYDNLAEMPSRTYYLNIPKYVKIQDIATQENDEASNSLTKYKTMHSEGNYGFSSYYNEYDIEIKRIFLDNKNKETSTARGYSELRFDVYSNGAIREFSYYLHDKKVEINGKHKVKLIYNDNNYFEPPTRELYYDINDEPSKSDDGVYGMEYSFNNNYIRMTRLNIHSEPCADNDNIVHEVICLNTKKQPEFFFSFDLEHNLCKSDSSRPAISFFDYFVNSKFKYIVALSENFNIIKTTCYSYNKQNQPLTLFSCDNKYNIIDGLSIQYNNNKRIFTTYEAFGQIKETWETEEISPNSFIKTIKDGRYVSEVDSNGKTRRLFKCDDSNLHIHDDDGSWETRCEYEFVKSANMELKTKELYYSQNGEPFEIQPGVYGYAWKYELPTNPIALSVEDSDIVPSSFTLIKREYDLNSRGEPILNCVKYCYENDNYAFYDESQLVATKSSRDGVHARLTVNVSDCIYQIRNYDTEGKICDCHEGWAIFVLERSSRYFLNNQREPVNGPLGWHVRGEIATHHPKDMSEVPFSGHIYLDKDKNVVDSDDGAVSYVKEFSFYNKLLLIFKKKLSFSNLFDVIFSHKIFNSKGETLKSAFIIYNDNNSRLIYQPEPLTPQADSVQPIYKLHALNSSASVNGLECVMVSQAPDNSKSRCMERDVIIQFGEWTIFDYVDKSSIKYKKKNYSDLMLENFARTFDTYQENKNTFTLKYARLSENNIWNIYSVEIAIQTDSPSIGKLENKRISNIAYSEIFTAYDTYIRETNSLKNDILNSLKNDILNPLKNDIDEKAIVARAKELLPSAYKMLPCNNEITPE